MGLDQADFTKAFLVALNDEGVINKLSDVVTRPVKFDLDSVMDSNAQLMSEVKKFQEINISLRKEVAELREIVKSKNAAITELKTQLEDVEDRLDEYEQYSRRNTLRVSGVPEEPNESIDGKILSIFNTRLGLDPPMIIDDIDRVHRVGKPDQRRDPRQVLVKFSTYRCRQRVYKERKKLRQTCPAPGQQPESAVVAHEEEEEGDEITSDGEPIPLPKIYLNEDLTKTRATLLWKTRQLKNAKKIKGCWSNDGRIFIEDKFGRIKQMKNSSDLDGLNWLKW